MTQAKRKHFLRLTPAEYEVYSLARSGLNTQQIARIRATTAKAAYQLLAIAREKAKIQLAERATLDTPAPTRLHTARHPRR